MSFVSTRDHNANRTSYQDVLLEGLAPDGGLYTPASYPRFSAEELTALRTMPYESIVHTVKCKLAGDSFTEAEWHHMIDRAYTREKFMYENHIVPLTKISRGLYVQNLSQGPTASFKDMALQLVGQELQCALKKTDRRMLILAATSGDTGSAAEAAVKGLDGIHIVVLSPKEGMSAFQKAQMGALSGTNVFNISVDGRFDDCQDIVKACHRDEAFKKTYSLGAVNSINFARIAAQVPYSIAGWIQATASVEDVVDFVVPTGNFGNIFSVYLAKQMGIPIRRLIIATNENNVLDRVLRTGVYDIKPSVITSSPSMDISKSSNFERLLFDMMGRDVDKLTRCMKRLETNGTVDLREYGILPQDFEKLGFISGTSSHQDRLRTIKQVHEESGMLIDPHTSDAVKVAKQNKEDDVPVICLETALPLKFKKTIFEAIGGMSIDEDNWAKLDSRFQKHAGFSVLPADTRQIKDFIREKIPV